MDKYFTRETIIAIGLVFPGLMTALGAVPVFFTKNVSQKLLDVMLGFAAGIMLSATCFSLVMPSIEYGGGDFKAVMITSAGIILGAFIIDMIDKFSPHEHLIDKRREGVSSSLSQIWLFIIAITIHNFPEGMATGVGFGTENIGDGLALALGIGIQNMPEGLAVALSLMREKYSVRYAFIVAALTGLVEPVGAVLGFGLVNIFKPVLPVVLASAAGAMLFVICDEIIPETHSKGYEREATYGIIFGFVIMMVLDILLG
ncbi:MAG: ZIP family metal transporter [Fenollaria massiliensis]|uniref:ZIP family metal transporter n=1 Tax=Fenollaria massiliensis TaxID=938288 RepID=UPI000370E9FB|nr:ZIP family metal transporter [Fenollaria massiliensis]AVM66951.1 ZIP family metal transporter [Peptostreptococcaceae bacterium oral taxon 929]